MKVFTEKKFREHELSKDITINELRDNIRCYSEYICFLEEKQNKIRDMLYDLVALRKPNVAKGTIFTKAKKIIDYIERGA